MMFFFFCFFFFKQKTAYEMRISDWSSDVCSSDLLGKERLDDYLRRFGFGAKTALDSPNESAGIMRDTDDYSGTSMGSIPIGQGISVTALQKIGRASCRERVCQYV